MKNDNWKFKSSGLLTFVFMLLCPGIVLLLLSESFSSPILKIVAIGIWILLLLRVTSVKVYDDKVTVRSLLKSEKYDFSKIDCASQTRLFSPKMCFICLKGNYLTQKRIIFLPPPRNNDILLIQDEDVVTFINEKIAEPVK